MLPYMSPRPRDRARVSCVSCTEGRFFSSEPLGKPLICVYSHKLSFDAMESEKNQRASRSVLSDSLRTHGLWPAKLLCPWNSPGKHTGVGCHFLLQGIFPTQGSNLGLLQWGQILYHLSHHGSHGSRITNVRISGWLLYFEKAGQSNGEVTSHKQESERNFRENSTISQQRARPSAPVHTRPLSRDVAEDRASHLKPQHNRAPDTPASAGGEEESMS